MYISTELRMLASRPLIKGSAAFVRFKVIGSVRLQLGEAKF